MIDARVELMAIFKRCVGGAASAPPVKSNRSALRISTASRASSVPFGASICRTSTALRWSRSTGPPVTECSP